MPMLRESQTAVVARNVLWEGAVKTEPYEAGWALEMVVFVRFLSLAGPSEGLDAFVQISPDGIHWVDEGTRLPLPASAGPVAFARLAHFGQFVRLRADLPEGVSARVLVTLTGKG